MITSNYFKPSFDFDEKISVDIFNYTELASKGDKNDQEYPLYLVLNKNSVDFYFLGEVDSKERKSDFKHQINLFSSVLILSLSFDEIDGVENEEFVLKCFNMETSIKTLDKYVKPALMSRNGFSYANHPGFGIDREKKTIFRNCLNKEKDHFFSQKFNGKLCRKLILDFLDDFFNNNIFRLSANFNSLESKILNSKALKGIYLKADFMIKSEAYSKEKSDPIKKQFYIDSLDKWTEFISNDRNSICFIKDAGASAINSWFDFLDVEIMRALTIKRGIFFFGFFFEEKKDSILKRSVNKLIQNYEIVKAGLILLISYSFLPLLIMVLIILISIQRFYSFQFEHLHIFESIDHKRSILFPSTIIFLTILIYFSDRLLREKFSFFCRNITSTFIKWCLIYAKNRPAINILNKRSIIKKRLEKVTNFFVRFLNFFYKIIIFFLPIFGWTYWLLKCDGFKILEQSNWSWLLIYAGGILFIGVFFILASLFVNSSAINIILPKIVISTLTSWIAILSSFDLWKNGFDVSIKQSITYGGLLIILAGFFLLFQIRKNTGISDLIKIIWKAFNVIIPGFMISLTIGIIGFSLMTKKVMTESDFFESKSVRNRISRLHFYDQEKEDNQTKIEDLRNKIIFQEKNIQYKIKWDSLSNTKKRLYVEEKGYEDPLEIYNHIEEFQLKNKTTQFIYKYKLRLFNNEIIIIPGFLILASSFALFSAVFLTLIFDNKSVTEPL